MSIDDRSRSKTPLTAADLEIAIGALFGTDKDRAEELTPEQKAAQEAKLAPFMQAAKGNYSAAREVEARSRSEAARAGRLKVLARKAAQS